MAASAGREQREGPARCPNADHGTPGRRFDGARTRTRTRRRAGPRRPRSRLWNGVIPVGLGPTGATRAQRRPRPVPRM